MGMKIISAGPFSTLQDAGRYGYMEYGFSTSGAMDAYSYELANALVGNGSEAVIEMTLSGITAEFTTPAIIALTGAETSAKLNGRELPRCKAVRAEKGDVLECGFAADGCRAYLAVAGGFYLKPAMGSYSTNVKCGIGGYMGRALKDGDLLFFTVIEPSLTNLEKRVCEAEKDFKSNNLVRAVLGPQDDLFTAAGIETFFGSEYKLTAESDRMGVKLDGPAVETVKGSDIVSDGIPLGGVQIPASGKPIIMAADRQTTGGYAKIATVISADMHKIAQLKPGDTLRFIKVTQAEAEKIAIQNHKEIEKLRKQWKR